MFNGSDVEQSESDPIPLMHWTPLSQDYAHVQRHSIDQQERWFRPQNVRLDGFFVVDKTNP